MTAQQYAPPARHVPSTVDKATFRHALDSEWFKIRTVRSTFWTAVIALVVIIGLSVLLSWAFVSSWNSLSASDREKFDASAYGLVGASLFGPIVVSVLGVLVISTEYSTGMIKTTFTAQPNRTMVLAAKALALALLTFIICEIATFAAFFLSQLVFHSKGIGASIASPGMFRAVLGAGLYLTVVALMAFALGVILRHTAGAISAAVGIFFVLPLIANFTPSSWKVGKYLPSGAGGAIMTTHHNGSDSFPPWVGFAIFCGYTAVLLGIALMLVRKRDA